MTNSVEFSRIVKLPRRILDLSRIEDVTPLFRKEGGTLAFWPIQSAALIEASIANGLFGPISVGFGKSLIALTLPEALDSKNTVLLVKPDLKRQLQRDVETFYSKHFNLPIDRITVVAYSELSSARHATILEDIGPDLIIADEAHCLRHRTSARTKRFLRYMKEHSECRFAALSGTMTNRSLNDYAHLLELALRKNSPLPRGYREVQDWAGAIDVEPNYSMHPGALLWFCDSGESVRSGFRRRLVETQGVVATEEGLLGTSLIVRKLGAEVPSKLFDVIEEVRKTWALEGEEYETALDLSRAVKQLICGFYYRWKWPDGKVDYEWLEARRNWHREVREKLKRATEGFDSPLLLAQAAERYRVWDDESDRSTPRPDKAWDSAMWNSWRLVKDRAPPPTEAVWLSDYLVDKTILWANQQDAPAIVWYDWTAVGERIAQEGRFPFYGAGTDASLSQAPVIVCSIRSQGTGKNLQYYSRNLFVSLLPNGTTFEQTVGRTHRPGQQADEVVVDWFGHMPELEDAMAKVIEDAKYMQATTGQKQKVLYASHLNEGDSNGSFQKQEHQKR